MALLIWETMIKTPQFPRDTQSEPCARWSLPGVAAPPGRTNHRVPGEQDLRVARPRPDSDEPDVGTDGLSEGSRITVSSRHAAARLRLRSLDPGAALGYSIRCIYHEMHGGSVLD